MPVKTKELIIDFRKRPLCQYPVVIGDTCVNVVRSYKSLGIVIDDRLSWYENSDLLYKKGRKRLYFLRKLNSFHIDNELLSLFYSTMVQSVICYGLVCWWSCLTVKDKHRLNLVRRTAERIIGVCLTSLDELHKQSALSKIKQICKVESELNDMIV